MKKIKIVAGVLGGILLVVITGFFLIGIVNPTTTYENSITVNKPVDVVWDIFTNADNMKHWLVGMESMETLEGEALTPGSRYRLTFRMEGEEIVITEEVTEVKENELFAFNLDSEPLTSQVEIRFSPIDSTTTEIKAGTTSEGKGPVWKSIIGMSGSVMQQQSQLSYDQLKTLIDTMSVKADSL